MEKKKIKGNKKPEVIKYVNEDTNQMKKFVFILIGVAIIALLLYFLTAKFLVKDAFQENNTENTSVTISYDTVKVGSVFNRPYDEYYVYAYDTTSNKANYYSTFTSKYTGELKIYTLDLSNEINKKYVSEKGNANATKPEELQLVEPTLIHIKNGSIAGYYEGVETIEKVLK